MSASPPARAAPPRGLRQSMADLHTWAGLLVGWVLYAMFLTGTVSYFREEISLYLRPELQAPGVAGVAGAAAAAPEPGQTAQQVLDAVLARAPGTQQIGITLPTARNPGASAYWTPADGQRGDWGHAVFDAHGQSQSLRQTEGGDFFYGFHFNLHYLPIVWGRWIAGFCAMCMLVAIVSGVITHKKIFADFFTFRWGKGQRSWMDAHNGLSVLGLPFHFMITYSGLVMLMALYMPWGEQLALNAQERAQAMQSFSAWRPPAPPQPNAAAVPTAPLAPLVAQAQQHWADQGQDGDQAQRLVGQVLVNNPGQASARVIVSRSAAGRISDHPRYLVFDGSNGQLLESHDSAAPAAQTRGVLYGLHMGRFADGTLRWLYFLTSLAGTAMVGSGLVLWTVKRRARLADPARPHIGFALVERLNIAAIAGLSVAMAGFFWLNRLLPLGLAQRAQWEIHGFFIVWALALLYAFLRPARRAWVELLALAAALLALLPLLSALTTERHLLRSLAQADWVFAGLELALLAFAALHAQLAWRAARHQPRAAARKPARRQPGQATANAAAHASASTAARSAQA
ncbi:PepSY domain-containing protein [Vandammella animalimorsus]|uniref:PepSY domain-containing protein n=1 Tax=Vandammella animalimorsus TaxID=2029117 RepID=A0A3M6RKQ7_9BURK|nr:PepSY-associated TM helix domain-containing protein [Vandammella animalimorsus]RMX16026.1 PepSY domain-containing protein [Vandammella animalimorsus]